MKKTLDDLEMKCPVCGSKVNYCQRAKETCDLFLENGELWGGDVIESYDFEFMDVHCDNIKCGWTTGSLEDALEQMKKAQGIED